MDSLNAQALAYVVWSLACIHHRPSPQFWEHACERTRQLLKMAEESEPGSFGFTAQSRATAAAAAAAGAAAGVYIIFYV